MPTERRIIECAVCHTRIGTRTLIGFLDRHPILLSCPTCNIDISGELVIDHENVRFKLTFQNARDVSDDLESASFYAEISGELLTNKMRPLEDHKLPRFVSPMFKAIDEMGEDKYALYKTRIVGFINQARSKWPTLKRINELWARGQTEFCKAEIRKLLPEDKYPLANDLGVLTAVKHLNVGFMANVLPDSFLEGDATIISALIRDLAANKGRGLLDIAGWLGHANKFNRFRTLFVARVEHFIRTFPHFVPVFSVPYCKGDEAEILRANGLFTGNLSSLSQFYIDSYENLIEMSDGVIALRAPKKTVRI